MITAHTCPISKQKAKLDVSWLSRPEINHSVCKEESVTTATVFSGLQVAQLPLTLPQDEWQHICVSWTLRDGVWKAYQGGKMKGRGEGLAAWHPIKPGGVLILGQEQVRYTHGWIHVIINQIDGCMD